MLAFMDNLRWLFSPRSLFLLALAFAILLSTIPLIPRHAESWPGSDQEHDESCRFVKALNEHFGEEFSWNMPAKASLRVMGWGIADERKQNEVRDWAIAEMTRTELAFKVSIEFYETKPPDDPGHWRLLRVVEF